VSGHSWCSFGVHIKLCLLFRILEPFFFTYTEARHINHMNRWIGGGLLVGAALIGGLFALKSYVYRNEQVTTQTDYKDAEYVIDGTLIKLDNGVAQTEAAPGSASKIVTRYFGNELKTDLDGDGRDDVVFLLTQERGGSGTFFYAVAALDTDSGYVGSDGYLLGDRIAPQTTEESENPRHKYVIVVKYAGRAPDEPMTVQPSLNKRAYLKLDAASLRWGIVEPDFEGESR
jgi:hypothetical protein